MAGLLEMVLNGKIGPTEPISLAVVRRQLATQQFDRVSLQVNSVGGDFAEAIAIYNHLRALPVPIRAVAKENCASGGMLIFLAASLRLSVPGTDFLIHPASCARTDLPERVTDQVLRQQADHLARIDRQVVDILVGRTGYDREFFEAEIKTELSLDETEAIKSGIVHQWIGVTQPCDSNWPDLAEQLAGNKQIYIPSYQRSQNYVDACRCAAFFPASIVDKKPATQPHLCVIDDECR
jgi:ATP-dependent protease ClpP protease subunit